jgi:hypothetical protein
MQGNRAKWSRRNYEAGLAFTCLGLAGCTALLGDFSSSPEGPADGAALDGRIEPPDVEAPDGTDASDATTPGHTDAASSSDAPFESGRGEGGADAAVGRLTCKTWLYAQPVVLEVLSTGNRSVGDPLLVFPLPSGRVRVIAGKSGGVPFSVYTVDTSQAAAQVTRLDAPSVPNGAYANGHRSGSSIQPYTAVAFVSKPLMVTGSFYAYVLPDTMPANGPLPATFAVYGETIQLPAVNELRVLPFSTTDLFTAVAYPTQTTPTNYVLGVGRATTAAPATLTSAATTPNADDLRNPVMFHANSNVYIYDQNDNSSPGLSAWTVPDTGTVVTASAKRAISGGQPAFLHDVAESTMSAAADVAYQSGIIAAGGGAITCRAGTVDYAKLDSWVSTDLPVVRTFSDASMAPIFPAGSGADSRWSSDSMMLLGPGSHAADGGVAPGLNLLWFDATGAIRSEEDGPNAVLTDRSDFTAATASPISLGAANARWGVAWVETKSDDAGTYDTLMYDELDCQ